MNIKRKEIELKADNGAISGYAATWTREPDSYGDVIAKGAFTECLEKLKEEGRKIPLLFNHDSAELRAYIGIVNDLEEDDHGLKFDAGFDATDEAQRARELTLDGRLCKFSFAYDILDEGEVELEDGRKANELRKLNIHEVSLVMYPANPDTGVIEVKSAKAGRRNSMKDEDKLRQIIALAQECLGELDEEEPGDDQEAKPEEQDPANDEEQKNVKELMDIAKRILRKGEEK